MYEFFVSYSRYDAEFARAASETFSLLGVPSWMAEDQILIEGRRKYDDREVLKDILEEAIASSRNCLLVTSHRSLRSEWIKEVELPPFMERGEQGGAGIVWPLIVGPDSSGVLGHWPEGLAVRPFAECKEVTDVAPSIEALCRTVGVFAGASIGRSLATSNVVAPTTLNVTTEHRKFRFLLDIGSEWVARPPIGRAMLLNLRDGDTGLALNLVVGAMPVGARETTAVHIEQANYFAEPYVTRRIKLASGLRVLAGKGATGRQRARAIKELLVVKLINAVTGSKEILGSHVLNVQGQPHFAYTYRLRTPFGRVLIARKYSVILAPRESSRFFEFVFTAGFEGDYEDFIRRVPKVDSIVHSFRFLV